ncbi:MAG: phosphoglycerate kinase [Acidobacteria bacterium]|nr:phosphoglycerate kinase [Acidobacteriota bacterium]
MPAKISVRDLDFTGKTVFLRVDFNVPLEGGQVADSSRLQAALPTIELILAKGGALVLGSHLGRPGGKRVKELGMAPVAAKLSELLASQIASAEDCIGPEVEQQARELEAGQVLLLENLRFHPGETANDPRFADGLARLADLYVNDAFGTVHRDHASVVGICSRMPVAAAGLLLEKELLCLSRLLSKPERPFIALIGGAKVSGKVELLSNLLSKVDALLIGGAMSYTLLRGRGVATGDSPVEEDRVLFAGELLQTVRRTDVKFRLPSDHTIIPAGQFDSRPTHTPGESIPEGMAGVDIGPRTVQDYCKEIGLAKTILWNGPMGIFENPSFDAGTRAVGTAIAESTALSVVGGGDTVTAVGKFHLERGMDHLSTGGGAALELLSGKPLPGVEALTEKP